MTDEQKYWTLQGMYSILNGFHEKIIHGEFKSISQLKNSLMDSMIESRQKINELEDKLGIY